MSIDSRLREGLQRSMSAIATDPEEHLENTRRQGHRRAVVRRAVTAVAVVAAIATVAVVGPAVRDALRSQRREPLAPPSALPITGNYLVRITTADASGVGVPRAAGTWLLKLQADGVLQLAPLQGGNVGGGPSQYQLAGTEMLTTALSSANCPGVGRYVWSRSGSTLTFIPASDPCPLRVAIFSSHPWTAA
jgi:hypothetical protein